MRITKPQKIPFATCTHTRTSQAYYWNRNGVLQTAAANELRFDHDPVTGEFKGVLIEPERFNFIPDSLNRSNQTFTVNVGPQQEFGIVSFYGGGTVRITSSNPNIPSSGLFISGTEGDFTRVHDIFQMRRNNTDSYTFECAGSVRYIQFETIPQQFVSDFYVVESGGVFVDGEFISPLTTPTLDDIKKLARPTSPIVTGTSGGALRSADVLSGFGIIGTTYTEPSPPPSYSSGAVYGLGDKVVFEFVIYESLDEDNEDNQPDQNPDKWLRIRTVNDKAFIDLDQGDRSTGTGESYFAIRTGDTGALGRFNSAAMLDISAQRSATFFVQYPNSLGGFYASKKSESNFPSVINPVQVSETIYMDDFVDDNLPSVSYFASVMSGSVRSNEGVDNSLGEVLCGIYSEIGDTQSGLRTSIIDFSRTERDQFGQFNIIKRGFSKRVEADIFVSNEDYNRSVRLLNEIRQTPVLFATSGRDDLAEGAIVFGYYRDYEVVVDYPNHSLINIEIEGLT